MPIDDLALAADQLVEDYRWTGDRGAILGPAADRDAAALWRSVRAVDPDTASRVLDAQFSAASTALGRLSYWRFRASRGRRWRLDLARALVCLEAVADDASVVPVDLRPVIGRFTDPDAQAELALTVFLPSASGRKDAGEAVAGNVRVGEAVAGEVRVGEDPVGGQAAGQGPPVPGPDVQDPALGDPAVHDPALRDPALLDAGILLMTPAAAAAPALSRVRGVRLSYLCLVHRVRHEQGGSAADLDLAVAAGEESVAIAEKLAATLAEPGGASGGASGGTSGGEEAEPWSRLAAAYSCRHRLRGDVADLLRAVDLWERALAFTGPRAPLLSDLAAAHRRYYERTGDVAHAERATARAEEAATLTEGGTDPAVLLGLSTSLLRRYERSGARTDLRRAADLALRAVAALPDHHPERGVHLADAATVLLGHHERSGALEDLDRAVDLGERALSALPDEDPHRRTALGVLAAALHRRHVSAGNGADLDRAAALAGWALAATPPAHPDRDRAAIDLASVHLTRFLRSGVLADAARAVELGERALAGSAARPPLWLSLLGDVHRQRHRATGAVGDLDRAIALGEEAVAATEEGDTARAGRRARLAAAYLLRYGATAHRSDLDRAVELGERAVAGAPDDHADLPEWLSGLAAARLDRYRCDKASADLDAAVALGARALESVPDHHPGRSRWAAGLCAAHRERMLAGGPAPGPDRLRALARAVTEAGTAAPADRLAAHHAVGVLALAAGQDRLAVAMLDAATGLLPSVAPREAGWADQQHRLGEHHGLVTAAVATHCAVGDPAGAVETAELGRGVLLASQAGTRADLAELTRQEPRLAGRFRWTCARLNTPGFPHDERRQWWAEYDGLLAGIRELPGLHRFLAPPRMADLRPAAAGGCVVLVNAGPRRGDAVLVRPDGDPVTVALPDLRPADVEARVAALLTAVRGNASLAGALRGRRVVSEVLGWLWDAVVAPVADALGSDGAGPYRVWWLPTGLVGLLPLHAAGHSGQRGALDTMVSSYAPSLRALREARDRPPAGRRRPLTVALRRTPDLPDLPGAAAEAVMLGGPALVDEQATADAVLGALEEATWVHFACHAVVDPVSQADSGLRLHDRLLRLSEIGGLRLPAAELAYLSACSTADHGVRYPDETLHLASAFQAAGFRHVVASLWPLGDAVAVEAARAFHRELSGATVADEAATVLRRVTIRLRSEHPDRPDLWAPLVHSGP